VRKNRLIVFEMLTEERKQIDKVDAILKNRIDLSKKEVATLKKIKKTLNASIRHIMTSDLNFDLLEI
jgi:G3E family GTPase